MLMNQEMGKVDYSRDSS